MSSGSHRQVFNALDKQRVGRIGKPEVLQAMQGLGFQTMTMPQLEEHMDIKAMFVQQPDFVQKASILLLPHQSFLCSALQRLSAL